MKNNYKNKHKGGYLFWITGLSGSGKTSIAKNIKKEIENYYGPTVVISGDNIRKIFKLKGYTRKERAEIAMKYCKLSKFLTSQNINVIFASISLISKIRKWNKKNIKKYVEIYIKADLKKIIKKGKKKLYFRKLKNMIGFDIKPELPKNPDIIINNNLKKDVKVLSKELIKKINRII